MNRFKPHAQIPTDLNQAVRQKFPGPITAPFNSFETPRVGGKSVAIKCCNYSRRGIRGMTFKDKRQPVVLTVPITSGSTSSRFCPALWC